jgi:plasmid stability protein
MAILTIRNLDETIKRNLRLEAARHGCSMEEEARRILRRALTRRDRTKGLGSRIHQRFAVAGGLDLSLPARSAPRPAPDLLKEA